MRHLVFSKWHITVKKKNGYKNSIWLSHVPGYDTGTAPYLKQSLYQQLIWLTAAYLATTKKSGRFRHIKWVEEAFRPHVRCFPNNYCVRLPPDLTHGMSWQEHTKSQLMPSLKEGITASNHTPIRPNGEITRCVLPLSERLRIRLAIAFPASLNCSLQQPQPRSVAVHAQKQISTALSNKYLWIISRFPFSPSPVSLFGRGKHYCILHRRETDMCM